MSTEVNYDNATSTESTESTSSSAIASELVMYRKYGTVVSTTDDKGVETSSFVGVDEKGNPKGSPSNLQETSDHKNWDSQDKRGATILTQNSVRFYSLNALEGFNDLVPDSAQQLYIINRGLATLQNAAVAAKLNETDESGNFLYNDAEIDLRAAINEPPKRVSLNPAQKIMKDLSALSPEEQAKLLQSLMAQLTAQVG